MACGENHDAIAHKIGHVVEHLYLALESNGVPEVKGHVQEALDILEGKEETDSETSEAPAPEAPAEIIDNETVEY